MVGRYVYSQQNTMRLRELNNLNHLILILFNILYVGEVVIGFEL